MRIEDHKLVEDAPSIEVSYLPDAYHRRFQEPPAIVVIHYTVGLGAAAIANYLRGAAQEYLSAHTLISTNGHVRQMVPFDFVAYHAGESSYQGREGCNDFAIGIELENPGPVFRQADGSWHTVQGQSWPGRVYEGQHKNGRAPSWTHWGEYTQHQIDLCAHLVTLLRREYPTIVDVVGHDDIAPGRKTDPGPAFPMNWLRSITFPEQADL